jgi:hypothetical protein
MDNYLAGHNKQRCKKEQHRSVTVLSQIVNGLSEMV